MYKWEPFHFVFICVHSQLQNTIKKFCQINTKKYFSILEPVPSNSNVLRFKSFQKLFQAFFIGKYFIIQSGSQNYVHLTALLAHPTGSLLISFMFKTVSIPTCLPEVFKTRNISSTWKRAVTILKHRKDST